MPDCSVARGVVGGAGVFYDETDVFVFAVQLDVGRGVGHFYGRVGGKPLGYLGNQSPVGSARSAHFGKQLGVVGGIDFEVRRIIVPVGVVAAVELEVERRYRFCKSNVEVVVSRSGRQREVFYYCVVPHCLGYVGIGHSGVPY